MAPSERIALLGDTWALVRAGERTIGAFLDLCARAGGERDHAVLDELVGRLAGIEARLPGEQGRRGFQAFVEALLGPALAAEGWEPAPQERDLDRLRRAALVRAVGLVARTPAVVAEGTRRLERYLGGERGALEPNLHEPAVVMAARAGDARRFDDFRARFPAEPDPALQRRYLVALALFEDPALAAKAQELAFGDEIPLQDVAFFAAGLLANRSARDGFWGALRARWPELEKRLGAAPMLLRRVVEAVGQLPTRRHLEEAQAFFAAHPIPSARQAVEQTLERMRQEVALWERAGGEVERWIASRRR